MDFKQVGTLGTPIIIAAKNQLPELNGSYKGIFFKTTYDPSSEEDYPKGTILTVVENSDGTFSWSKPTILERLTNGITDGSQLLKDIEAFDGKGNKIVGTLESGSGTGDIKNPYKARTYSEMNGYRTKDYANAYVEYTGQRQFTRGQIQNSSMYDKLYFDFPRQIGWVETFDWNNPDSNWTSDGLLYKCIVLFNVTPTKTSDNTTEDAIPFSVYQMTTTRDSSDVQVGTIMYGIGFPSSFSWVSWGGTPDKEYSRTGYKLKITDVKEKYHYFIGDIISTTGEWSQIINGTQFGYKHGTYKIDTNSNTVDNFQKLDLVLEDGGSSTARKTITNNYSYNLNSYYDYILKYSYEGKSSSIICKVGNFEFEGTQITGANQLYNITSDGDPAGIFFPLDASCPFSYGWNSASIIDNFDLSNPRQSTSNKSVVGVVLDGSALVGKTVTIDDISTAADMIYYTTLPSLSTPAAATDIVKGKQAIDAEGNRISGTLELVNNPYAAKNETELLNYCNGKYENAIVKVEDLTKTVETEIAIGDAISKLYFNTSITPDFSNLNWSNPDYERDGILVINILQSEEHFNNGEEDISWDGMTVRRYDCSNQDSANPYRYSLNFASWFTLWTDNEFLHANNPDFYPVPGWNYTGLKTLGWLGIKNNVFSINSLMGQAIHVKAMKSQDLWKSFVSSTQDAWESKYYKIGEPDKNVLTSPVSLTCRSGNSVDLAYTLKLDKNSQWVINLTLGNTTVNKVVKQTNPVLNGTSIGGSQTLVELDWTSGNTNGINVDFGNNETINLFIGDCMDFNDTNHQGQYNSSASTFVINNASSMASGYELTINSITPISSYDEYHYLAAQNTILAMASDIKKGKGAFNTNGEFVVGNYEPIVLPTLTNEGTAADLAAGKQLISSSGEIVTGTGTIIPTPEPETRYFVKVIDYDGTELLSTRGENGDSFTLPPAPSHDGLVFQEWSASCPITNGTVTINNNNIMVGAVYTTASGLNEFDIELTEDFGLSISLEIDGEKNWGDGTTDSETTHTYAAYGNYTIKCGGTSLGGYFYSMPCTFARLATVTSISEFTFDGCHSLASITISNSLTSIGQSAFSGNGAFSGCSNLTSITIPNGITSINQNTFNNYNGLTSIIIPNSVTSIGQYAFNGCHSLTSIAIPDSVTSIDSYAFKDCNSLTSIATGNGVQNIYDNVFYNCNRLTNIIIGNNVTGIGRYAFYGCGKLTSITIPNSVMNVGNYAFQDCNMLTSVTIGNGMKSIGSYAFSNCSGLTSITIPDSVTSIGSYAFQNCNMLINVTLGNGIKSISSDAFQGCSSLASITIPNSVTSISEYAFAACRSLTSITIPNSVTSINKNAFAGCINLTSITIPNGMTSINEYTLSGCSGLISITIPNSVTSIEYHAFSNCSRLTNITIPDSVTSIRGYAFSGCNKLASITIGSGVTSIGNYTFSGCNKLTSITIPNGVTSIGESAFGGCTGLVNITLLPTTPPVLSYLSPFADIPSNAIFTVPKGTLNAYKAASGWSTYADKIVEATE